MSSLTVPPCHSINAGKSDSSNSAAPISSARLCACRTAALIYGAAFPVVFALALIVYIFGGFAIDGYWSSFFSSYESLWSGLPSSPAAEGSESKRPSNLPQLPPTKSALPTVKPSNAADASPEQRAAWEYRQEAIKSMAKKYDEAPDDQKYMEEFTFPGGATQKVFLFFTEDRESISAPSEAIVNAANPTMDGPAAGINAAIWNLYPGKEGWRKTAAFAAGLERPLAKLQQYRIFTHEGPTYVDRGVRVNRPAFIFQALGPSVKRKEKPTTEQQKNLQAAYREIMRKSVRKHINTITIANISTGIYNYPKNAAAAIAVDTVMDKLDDWLNPTDEPIYIWFAQYDSSSIKYYKNEFAKLKKNRPEFHRRSRLAHT
jgi:O-acetyl-ADP-ribose deacetylase (regulator of RNase III)